MLGSIAAKPGVRRSPSALTLQVSVWDTKLTLFGGDDWLILMADLWPFIRLHLFISSVLPPVISHLWLGSGRMVVQGQGPPCIP
jgi:hypothetical protein